MTQTPPIQTSSTSASGTAADSLGGSLRDASGDSSRNSASEAADPLANLYKMSRTAGLGSGDYVAINAIAVTSLVFGLASALVIVDALFVVIPIVGLILGVIAFRQVYKSNGTQAGGWMAGVAIALSLCFLGGKVGKEGLQSMRRSADKRDIEQIIDTIGLKISQIDPAKPADTAADMQAAYGLFDEAFRSRISQTVFQTRWLEMRASPYVGPLVSLHSSGLMNFDVDARTGDLTCLSVAIAQFKRGEPPRWTMSFRQLGGKWYIEDMPEIFPVPQQQQQAQPQNPVAR